MHWIPTRTNKKPSFSAEGGREPLGIVAEVRRGIIVDVEPAGHPWASWLHLPRVVGSSKVQSNRPGGHFTGGGAGADLSPPPNVVGPWARSSQTGQKAGDHFRGGRSGQSGESQLLSLCMSAPLPPATY